MRTDVGRGRETGTRWEGFLEHPGAKRGVARFGLVRGDPLGGAKVGRPRRGELALTVGLEGLRGRVAGRVVRQRYVSTLGFCGDGLAVAGAVSVVSFFGLGQSEVVGAVPLGAAGFGEVPQGWTFSSEPSTVCELLLLTLPAI